METFIVYPKNKKQKSLLKALLEQLNVQFKIEEDIDDPHFTKEAFFRKINQSMKQAEAGNTEVLSPEKQKALLGL